MQREAAADIFFAVEAYVEGSSRCIAIPSFSFAWVTLSPMNNSLEYIGLFRSLLAVPGIPSWLEISMRIWPGCSWMDDFGGRLLHERIAVTGRALCL